MDRLALKYRKLLRAYRVLKRDYAEQGVSVATLREMVRTLRTELAALGDRRFEQKRARLKRRARVAA